MFLESCWFISLHGQRLGPFSADELARQLHDGEISSRTWVWREGLDHWTPLGFTELGPQRGLAPESALSMGQDGVRRGGFWRRFIAYQIDSVILFVPTMLINTIALLAYGPELGKSIAWAVSMVLSATYFAVLQAYIEGSFGKRLLGLALVGERDYEELNLQQSLIRYAMLGVSMLAFFLGVVWIGFSRRKQGWHDRVARTVVVNRSDLERWRERRRQGLPERDPAPLESPASAAA